MNAPAIAKIVTDFLSLSRLFFIDKNPPIKNGRQIIPHPIQYLAGRYPSIMCIAFAAGVIPNISTSKIAILIILF